MCEKGGGQRKEREGMPDIEGKRWKGGKGNVREKNKTGKDGKYISYVREIETEAGVRDKESRRKE